MGCTPSRKQNETNYNNTSTSTPQPSPPVRKITYDRGSREVKNQELPDYLPMDSRDVMKPRYGQAALVR